LLLTLALLLLLPAGEHIGDGTPPMVDIAVDPLDGTTLTAQGRSGAIAVRPAWDSNCWHVSLPQQW
jgi:fructose-1,6-bisphosphatase/sedoheptulose 1,7-bisphosphatase-like protein